MPLSCATKEGVGSGRLLMGGSLPGEEPEGTRTREGGGEYLRKRVEKRWEWWWNGRDNIADTRAHERHKISHRYISLQLFYRSVGYRR